MSGSLQDTQWLRRGQLIVAQGVAPGSPLQPALDLSELKFHFHIRQQDTQTPNTVLIRVYNLSATTVRSIQNEFTRVIIQVGYQHAPTGVIFDGAIVRTSRGRENSIDHYLEIAAVEGSLPYQYAVINQTLAPGASPKDQTDALSKVLKNYNTPLDTPVPLIGGTLPRGKVLFGMALAQLDKICQTTGTTWTISDGKVVIVPLTGYLPNEAVVLNSQTGLVNAPEATQEGIQVTCLINPKIRVGTRVQIANALINSVDTRGQPLSSPVNPFAGAFASVTEDGIYRVLVVEYEGDSRGEPWYQYLTCLAIDPTAPPDKSVKLYP